MQTIKDCLEWGVKQLVGAPSAQLDCEILLGFTLNQSRTYLYTYPEKHIDENVLIAYQQAILDRAQGKPVAYITGEKEFWSLSLIVTADVLIPRPDTELLVERALCLDHEKALTVVDLGTGSGAIACAVAKSCPNWQVTATDCSKASLQIAKQNSDKHKLSNVEFIQGEWLEPFKNNSFDLILSNPPYIDPNDPHLQELDLRFEPIGALKAAEHGLACLRTIIQQAPSKLKPDGMLMVEHGFTQGPDVRVLMEKAGFIQIKTSLDLHGQERVTQGQIV